GDKRRGYSLTDSITRPLWASARSTVTVPVTLCAALAVCRPALMSAMNLSRANGGIAPIGKLSIITRARVFDAHWTAATLRPATGRLRIIAATASWNVAEDDGAEAAEATFEGAAASASTVSERITRLLAASATSTVTGPAT